MKFSKLKNISFLFLFISYISFAQNPIDSLESLLSRSKDSERIDILMKLSQNYKRINPQKTIEYAKEAYRLALTEKNELLIAQTLGHLGDGELLVGNLDTAEIYYKKAFTLFDKLENLEGLSDVYLDLGNIKFFNTVYDSAAIYYQKAIRFKIDLGLNTGLISLYNNLGAVYKKTGEIDLAIDALENSIDMCDQLEQPDKKGLAQINLASIYFTKGDLVKSMIYSLDALNTSEKTNDLYTKSNAYTNLGNIYSFLEDYKQALIYQNRSLQIDKQINDFEGIITAYNNIGGIYVDMNILDSAQFFFNKSLSLHESKDVKIDFESTTYNIGKVLSLKGEYIDALKYFSSSLETSKKINDSYIIVNNLLSIGEIYLNQNKLEKAENYLNEAYAINQQHSFKDEYKMYYLLSELFEKKNNLRKALDYHIKYSNIKDSLVTSKALILSEIKSSYDIQKQEKEIKNLHEESALQTEKIEKQETIRNILIVGFITILILLISNILNYKNKIKANKILEEQNEEIKEKNIEIELQAKNLKTINRELEKLSIATSQTDNAIIIANSNGEIEWINDGYTRLYGYTFEEFIQKKGNTYIESSSNPDIKEIFNKALSEKQSQIYEADVFSKDGKKYRIHTTLTPLLNKENEVVRLISIDSDITKLKQVEEELQKLLVTKDKFFSIIAHDLKNPFNSLMGLAQLLVHGYDRLNQEKVKYFHQNLYQISKNGYELLVNLLEWSRSQMGTIQYKPTILDLNALCEETYSLYQSKAAQKEITLTNNLNENSEILADQNMLKTILRNLVSNALKFTDRGGAIEISEKNLVDFKEIHVRDTGIGIQENDIKKLFKLDENYTTEGTEDETGTGLGLILCKEFVEKHGGKIWIESKVGFGSKFIFTLPLAK